jgi:hypothetical protein
VFRNASLLLFITPYTALCGIGMCGIGMAYVDEGGDALESICRRRNTYIVYNPFAGTSRDRRLSRSC